ncbi:MAG: AAA family ATPase [Oceanipulchritudo sp.]
MNSTSLFKIHSYLDAQSRTPARARGQKPLPAITISRESGACAHSVGQRVVQLLEEKRDKKRGGPWTLFDRDLVEKVLQDHELPERIRQFMPEDKIKNVADCVEALLGLHPNSWTLVHYTVDTILRLAHMGNVVIIGRGANLITENMPNVFHVRLIAPQDFRIHHLKERERISAKEAAKLVRKTDTARKRYVSTNFTAAIDDPRAYHLTINTAKTGFAGAADIIAHAVLSGDFPNRSRS